MKVDGSVTSDPATAVAAARRVEGAGYAGAWTSETKHDPFLTSLLALEHTEHLEVGTSIAVAFARTPMTVAHTANDLQSLSAGRFILGLGSQVKPHIERRFSMPWSKPAARMREFVSALRAIWATWHEEAALDFRGDFYQHTLTTPFFNPGPNEHGAPRVFLAGIGEKMTEVAGEVCDGFIVHSFSTPSYFRTVSRVALDKGRSRSQRPTFEVAWPVFVATGAAEEELVDAVSATKRQIAFYGSTPAYRGVLEHHGWGDLQGELNALARAGRWEAMGEAISDEVLDAFAVTGEPQTIAAEVWRRYGGLADRVSFYMVNPCDPAIADRISRDLQAQP